MSRFTARIVCGAAGAAMALAATLLQAPPVTAHPLAPALLEITELTEGRIEVAWKTSSVKVPGTNVRPILPPECKPVDTINVTEEAESVTSRWTMDCAGLVLVGATVAVEDLGAASTDALLRLTMADGRTISTVLRASAPSYVIPEREHPLTVAVEYARLGVEHILGGPDHLLFVFGLVLLVGGLRELVKTVTAFTVGHSITLSLAVLGFVRYPTALIELLIALSVFVLAVELTRTDEDRPSIMKRFPWMIAGSFGLLHGLGFAGALAEVGLPSNEIPVALFAFNVGIELGQIAFVLVIVAARSLLGGLAAAAPGWVQRVPLYVMGSLAAFWCFERAAGLF